MTATTHPEFNDQTEALEVAKAFLESIRGKIVLVTGVNREGIGFTTAQAFVSSSTYFDANSELTFSLSGLSISCTSHHS